MKSGNVGEVDEWQSIESDIKRQLFQSVIL